MAWIHTFCNLPLFLTHIHTHTLRLHKSVEQEVEFQFNAELKEAEFVQHCLLVISTVASQQRGKWVWLSAQGNITDPFLVFAKMCFMLTGVDHVGCPLIGCLACQSHELPHDYIPPSTTDLSSFYMNYVVIGVEHAFIPTAWCSHISKIQK